MVFIIAIQPIVHIYMYCIYSLYNNSTKPYVILIGGPDMLLRSFFKPLKYAKKGLSITENKPKLVTIIIIDLISKKKETWKV